MGDLFGEDDDDLFVERKRLVSKKLGNPSCSTCCLDVPEVEEPSARFRCSRCRGNQSSWSSCSGCWAKHLKLQPLGPRCLLCNGHLSYRDMKQLLALGIVTKQNFGIYLRDRRIKELTAMGTKDWIHCPTLDCTDIVTGSTSSPKTQCQTCLKLHCFVHRCPWDPSHEICLNSTTTPTNLPATEDPTSREQWFSELGLKKCPSCQMPTLKNGGCKHMTCCSCGYEWWWCCLRSFRKEAHEHYLECEGGVRGSLFGDTDDEDDLFAPVARRPTQQPLFQDDGDDELFAPRRPEQQPTPTRRYPFLGEDNNLEEDNPLPRPILSAPARTRFLDDLDDLFIGDL